MKATHQQLHDRALAASRSFKKVSAALVAALEDICRTKAYKTFRCSSLFLYARTYLGLSESTSYTFQAVAKKSLQFPQLSQAIRQGRISPFLASRMLSALTAENIEELITFAENHTQRELDFEVARRNPQKKKRSQMRAKSGDSVRLSTDLTRDAADKLKRAQNLMSKTKHSDLGEVIEKALDTWLDRNDPVRKAKRSKRPKKNSVQTENVPAAEAYAVYARDEGRCTFTLPNGKRCPNERWVQLHHLQYRKDGGTHDAENLTTLCSECHALVHQLDLPLNELRAPRAAYRLH